MVDYFRVNGASDASPSSLDYDGLESYFRAVPDSSVLTKLRKL